MLHGGTKYLWVVNMELASCHPSCILKFEVASRLLENLVAFVLDIVSLVYFHKEKTGLSGHHAVDVHIS
jgi:hypothetical protein